MLSLPRCLYRLCWLPVILYRPRYFPIEKWIINLGNLEHTRKLLLLNRLPKGFFCWLMLDSLKKCSFRYLWCTIVMYLLREWNWLSRDFHNRWLYWEKVSLKMNLVKKTHFWNMRTNPSRINSRELIWIDLNQGWTWVRISSQKSINLKKNWRKNSQKYQIYNRIYQRHKNQKNKVNRNLKKLKIKSRNYNNK